MDFRYSEHSFVSNRNLFPLESFVRQSRRGRGGGGAVEGTPYNRLYGEALQESGSLFRLEVNNRVGISRVEV